MVTNRSIPELSPDLVKAVIAEGGRLASEVMAPLNEVGDQHGCELKDGEVTTLPASEKRLRNSLKAAGWACRATLPLADKVCQKADGPDRRNVLGREQQLVFIWLSDRRGMFEYRRARFRGTETNLP